MGNEVIPDRPRDEDEYAAEYADYRRRTAMRKTGVTARELAVLRRVAEGSTDAEIAEKEIRSLGTIRSQVKSLRAKLDATTKAHAVAQAYRAGLLP